MGNAPCDVAPRSHALRRHQVGHIVESDDRAGAGGGADADQQGAPCSPLQNVDLPLGDAIRALGRLHDQRSQFGHDVGQRPFQDAILRQG